MTRTGERLRLQRVVGATIARKPRGGKREGAGREPADGDQPRSKLGIRVSKELDEFLDEACDEDSKTAFIERLLRESIEFRTWSLERQLP